MFDYAEGMTSHPSGPACATLSDAAAVLATVTDWVDALAPEALGELLTLIDRVGAAAEGARVAVTATALAHGLPAAGGQRPRDWVREHAPTVRQGGLGAVLTLAGRLVEHRDGLSTRLRVPPDSPLGWVWPQVCSGRVAPHLAVGVLDELDRLTPRLVAEAVPTVARALIDLGVSDGPCAMRRLRPALLARYGQDGELQRVQAALAGHAYLSQPRVQSGDLTEYRLAMTPEQAVTLEAAIGSLAGPRPDPDTGARDPRGAGQRRVEALTQVCAATLGPATTPPLAPVGHRNGSEHSAGHRSAGHRSAGHRSAGERCAVDHDSCADGGADSDGSGDQGGSGGSGRSVRGVPSGSGATVHVVINLTDLSAVLREQVIRAVTTSTMTSTGSSAVHAAGLVDRSRPGVPDPGEQWMPADFTEAGARLPGAGGAGTVLGSWATGTLLSPDTVRRLACTAEIIPHVLGAEGETLDLGRAVRLFTRAQRAALLRRDRHCTYPGCTAPADWCRVHHIRHWLDGGRTDLDNATLLCQHHHSIVHTRRLTAHLAASPDQPGRHITWDLTPHSYDTPAPHTSHSRTPHSRTPDPRTPDPRTPDPRPPGITHLLHQLAPWLIPPDPHDPNAGIHPWQPVWPSDLDPDLLHRSA